MNSAAKQLEPRPPSRPRAGEKDLSRAFASLEEDILSLQSFIERARVKCLDSGVHRGKLMSRRSISTTNGQKGSILIENSQSLQQYRNATLTEPIYNLIIATLGPHYASIPSETVFRLSLLKIKLHEVFLKKVSELATVKLSSEVDTEGRLITVICRFFEMINESKEPSVNEDKTIELEENIQHLKNELKKEAKAKKDLEDALARYVMMEKQRKEEFEGYSKKLKEYEECKGKMMVLMNDLEKFRHKCEQHDVLEAKIIFLQTETGDLNVKLSESERTIERLEKDSKKLKEHIEKFKVKERLNTTTIETLTSELIEIKKEIITKNNCEAVVKEFEDKIEELKKIHKLEMTKKIEELEKGYHDKFHKNLIQSTTQYKTLEEKSNLLEMALLDSEESKKKILNEFGLENSGLGREIIGLKAENEKFYNENTKFKSNLALLNSEIADKVNKISELQKELEAKDLIIGQLKAKTVADSSIGETEKFLSNEIMQLQAQLSVFSSKFDEKCILCERLQSEIKYCKADLQKSREANELIQDEFSKMNQNYDEDTFENVMRNELTIMRGAYEKRLKEARDEIDAVKKKQMFEVKKLKDEIKQCEHSKEYLEIKLKAFQKQ